MRVVIVDDEPLARGLLRSMLERLSNVRVVGEFGDPREFLEQFARLAPDVAFLDIRMPQVDGFELLESLGPNSCQVVFVTAYDEFALRAFEVAAADYLLKPFDEERLELTLARLRDRVATRPQQEHAVAAIDALRSDRYLARIATWKGDRILLRPLHEIRWFEAADKRVMAHVAGEPEVVRSTMGRLEQVLDPRNFVRVSRHAIVNLDHVREIRPWFHGDYQLMMPGGRTLRATKGFRAALESLLRGRSGDG